MKTKLRILQIATTEDTVTALCEDGSVWCYDHSAEWRRYPDIEVEKAPIKPTPMPSAGRHV